MAKRGTASTSLSLPVEPDEHAPIIGKDLTKEEEAALARAERQLAELFAEFGQPVRICHGYPDGPSRSIFFRLLPTGDECDREADTNGRIIAGIGSGFFVSWSPDELVVDIRRVLSGRK